VNPTHSPAGVATAEAAKTGNHRPFDKADAKQEHSAITAKGTHHGRSRAGSRINGHHETAEQAATETHRMVFVRIKDRSNGR
jgi:hypothetical protein